MFLQEAEDRVFVEPKSYLGPPLTTLKRKVGYSAECTELPKKMANMALTDVPNFCKTQLAM